MGKPVRAHEGKPVGGITGPVRFMSQRRRQRRKGGEVHPWTHRVRDALLEGDQRGGAAYAPGERVSAGQRVVIKDDGSAHLQPKRVRLGHRRRQAFRPRRQIVHRCGDQAAVRGMAAVRRIGRDLRDPVLQRVHARSEGALRQDENRPSIHDRA